MYIYLDAGYFPQTFITIQGPPQPGTRSQLRRTGAGCSDLEAVEWGLNPCSAKCRPGDDRLSEALLSGQHGGHYSGLYSVGRSREGAPCGRRASLRDERVVLMIPDHGTGDITDSITLHIR